MGEEAEWYVDV